MGLLSLLTHGRSDRKEVTDHNRILVFARSSTTSAQYQSHSAEAEIVWSLAVEYPSNSPQTNQESQSAPAAAEEGAPSHQVEHCSSTRSDTSSQSEVATCTDLFSLADGCVCVSRDFDADMPNEDATSQPVFLVKYHLKHRAQPVVGSQTLRSRIEQMLRAMTAAESHLANSQSETWIRYALLSLQRLNILPRSPTFNVNNFIYYVQQKTQGFETELLSTAASSSSASSSLASLSPTSSMPSLASSSSTVSSPAQPDEDDCANRSTTFVKEVNYQTHLEENARLKAMFDWAPMPTELVEISSANQQLLLSQVPPGIHGCSAGGFWVTTPQAGICANQRPNPYGGLM